MTDREPPVMPGGDGQEFAALAFTLGLLEGAELDSAIQRYQDDPAFAARVARLETRLADFVGAERTDADTAAGWDRIAAGLAIVQDRSEASPASANDNAPSSARLVRTLGLSVLAASLTFVALWLSVGRIGGPRPTPSLPPPAIEAISVAQINSRDEPIIALAYDRRSGSLKARFLAPADPQRVPELWLIGRDGKPVSLGYVRPGPPVVIIVPAALRESLAKGATIAISLEQPSDIRHPAPAGPILGIAKVSAI